MFQSKNKTQYIVFPRRQAFYRIYNMNMDQIKKRNGEIVPFDLNRIQIAITKAYQATHIEATDIPIVVDDISQQLASKQATLQE